MKIYIDVLMLTNCIITLIYLRCIAGICREKIPLKREIAAAAAGGAGSLLAIPQSVNFAGALMLTLAKGGVILAVTYTAFRCKNVGAILRRAALYLVCEIVMGGVCFLIITVTKSSILTIRNYVVYFDVSIWQLGLSCAAVYILFSVAGAVRIKYGAYSVGCRVTYTLGGYSREFPAVADTGNRLTDSFTGEPVVIFRSDELYRRYSLDRPELMSGYGFRLLPYETINGEGVIFVTSRGSVTVTRAGKTVTAVCCAGVIPGKGREYAILNPQILESN